MQQEHVVRGNVVIDIIRNELEACRPIELKINGKIANLYDLGRSKDIEPEKAPPCGCGNRVFIPSNIKEHTLKEYNLSINDVEDLMYVLKEKFTIGYCKRCK